MMGASGLVWLELMSGCVYERGHVYERYFNYGGASFVVLVYLLQFPFLNECLYRVFNIFFFFG